MKHWSVRKTIVISWLLGILINLGTVGGLTAYVIADDRSDNHRLEQQREDDAEVSQARRANICEIAEAGDQNILNLLIQSSKEPVSQGVIDDARAFIHAVYEDCNNPNPQK